MLAGSSNIPPSGPSLQERKEIPVALWLNTNTHIFLTHSFGTQIQTQCGHLCNMHLGPIRAKAEAVKVAKSWSLNYKYSITLTPYLHSSLVN